MAEYIAKDRETGEVLYQGSKKEVADFLGCSESYIKYLILHQPKYNTTTKLSKYKVERIGEAKRGGGHKKDIVCRDCGVLIPNTSAHRKRCTECSKKHMAACEREKSLRKNENGLVANPYIKRTNNNGCEGCFYYRGEYEINKCCNYIFIEGHRRPCPPDKECTVRIERKGYREKEK